MLLGEAKLRHACGKVNLDRNGLARLTLRAHWRTRISYAADLSPSQSQADQPSRFPRPNGRSLGPRGAFPPPQEGPQASHRSDSFEARRKLTAAEGLPRFCRLTRTSELRKVQETGRRKRLSHLDVLWTDNQAGHPRVGLIVPKFQSTAVARNRLRRRLREVWRRELARGLPPLDVVIRARREAYAAAFTALSSELLTWRLGMG